MSRYFLSKIEGKSIDDSLLQRAKSRVLSQSLFSLLAWFGCSLSTIQETLSSWHGAFVGRKQKKVWRAAPLCIFLDNLKGKKPLYV